MASPPADWRVAVDAIHLVELRRGVISPCRGPPQEELLALLNGTLSFADRVGEDGRLHAPPHPTYGNQVYMVTSLAAMQHLQCQPADAVMLLNDPAGGFNAVGFRQHQVNDFTSIVQGKPSRAMLGDDRGDLFYVDTKRQQFQVCVPLSFDIFGRLQHYGQQMAPRHHASGIGGSRGAAAGAAAGAGAAAAAPPQAHEFHGGGVRPGAGFGSAAAAAAAPFPMAARPPVTRTDRAPAGWNELAKVATRMRGIYNPGYAFPEWSVELLRSGGLAHLTGGVEVLFPACDRERLRDVKVLAREREPVNIEMERQYAKEKLRKAFDYTLGAYGKGTSDKLMPHIAIYCETPIRKVAGASPEGVTAHFINAIGMGFDSRQQPDYLYFMGGPGGLTEERWEQLKDRMRWTWIFIFDCAKRKGFKRIFNARVGGGFFAEELNRHGKYSYDVLYEATFPGVKDKYPDIEVRELREISDPEKMVRPESASILAESLLVNAWDPWSMVGNGNSRDDSLDGMMGRISAMAVLCWPQTNPDLTYVPVEAPC